MTKNIIKYIPDLKRYVNSKIDNCWAEDVVQETLLYLLLKIDNIKVTNLLGLMLNTANFFISKHHSMKKFDNNIPEISTKFICDIRINELNVYILDDKNYNKLLTVNQDHFNKLVLQISGYSIKEISEMYNTNENTIKTHIKRCKDYLKH